MVYLCVLIRKNTVVLLSFAIQKRPYVINNAREKKVEYIDYMHSIHDDSVFAHLNP